MQLNEGSALGIQLIQLRDERDPLARLLRRFQVQPASDSDDLALRIEGDVLVAGVTDAIGACVLSYDLVSGELTVEGRNARTGERRELHGGKREEVEGLVILALAELRGTVVGGPVFM